MSKIISLDLNVGDSFQRTVCCVANMNHGGGKPITETLKVQEITITAGSPLNGNKRMVRYVCFNETKGHFENLNEEAIKNILKGGN